MLKYILFAGLFFVSHSLLARDIDTKAEPMVIVNVTDAATKKPLTDVTVTVIHTTSKAEYVFETDDKGSFKINTLPIGTYKFKFEKENYKTFEKKEVAVKQDATTKLNVEIVNYKDEETEESKNWSMKFSF